jgi:membrane protease YdiL (CAAX protease family)
MTSIPPPEAAHGAPAPAPAPRPPERVPDEPPWGILTVLAATALGLAAAIFGSIFVAIVAQAFGSSISHPTPAVSLTEDLLFDLSFVAAAVYFVALRGRPRPADFGFRRIGLRFGLIAFATAGTGYYIGTAIYASIVRLHGNDKLPSELGVSKSTAALVAAAAFVCVIAPIAEEFFFRGFLFGALRKWRIVVFGRNIGTWVAAVVTGVMFGLIHSGSAPAQYLIPLAFFGFVLCLLRWWTRSLYPCMALHSFNNSLALGVNELHWSAAAIVGLMAASMLVIAAITGPLSSSPAPATS